MTLIELLIALTVMAVAIFALVAGLSSGIVAINRSGAASTAGSVADAKMEGYRRSDFASVPPTTSPPLNTVITTVVVVKGRTYGVRVDGSWVCPLGGTPADTSQFGTTTLGGTKIINLTDTSGLSDGVLVTGSGIPAGAVISGIVNSTTITLSIPATATAGSVSLTFLRTCGTGTVKNRAAKNVVVTIRDGAAGRVLVTETSTFDQATG